MTYQMHNILWWILCCLCVFLFAAPSRPPLEIKGRALTSSSILVQWDPPPVEHQNGEIESYIILCIEHNTGRTLRLDTTPITNVTISELHPFYSYVCNVSAVTVDSGPFSDTINVTTLEDGIYIIIYICM